MCGSRYPTAFGKEHTGMIGDKVENKGTDNDKHTVSDFDAMFEEPKKVRKKSRLLKPLIVIIVICFCIFAVGDIISQQAQIAELEKETADISRKITEAKQLNDEYERLLSSDEEEYMEKVAVEQLGYAYPNERRFYIVNGRDD